MINNETKICKSCGKPVEETSEYYEIQENMHWLCFHLEFEHDSDPDTPCSDPSCPWLHIEIFKNKLKELSIDPQLVLNEALSENIKKT